MISLSDILAGQWFCKLPPAAFSNLLPVVGLADRRCLAVPKCICRINIHYLIAPIFSVSLFLLYPNIIKLLKNKYVTIIYGMARWAIMGYVVLPLTNITKSYASVILIDY